MLYSTGVDAFSVGRPSAVQITTDVLPTGPLARSWRLWQEHKHEEALACVMEALGLEFGRADGPSRYTQRSLPCGSLQRLGTTVVEQLALLGVECCNRLADKRLRASDWRAAMLMGDNGAQLGDNVELKDHWKTDSAWAKARYELAFHSAEAFSMAWKQMTHGKKHSSVGQLAHGKHGAVGNGLGEEGAQQNYLSESLQHLRFCKEILEKRPTCTSNPESLYTCLAEAQWRLQDLSGAKDSCRQALLLLSEQASAGKSYATLFVLWVFQSLAYEQGVWQEGAAALRCARKLVAKLVDGTNTPVKGSGEGARHPRKHSAAPPLTRCEDTRPHRRLLRRMERACGAVPPLPQPDSETCATDRENHSTSDAIESLLASSAPPRAKEQGGQTQGQDQEQLDPVASIATPLQTICRSEPSSCPRRDSASVQTGGECPADSEATIDAFLARVGCEAEHSREITEFLASISNEGSEMATSTSQEIKQGQSQSTSAVSRRRDGRERSPAHSFVHVQAPFRQENSVDVAIGIIQSGTTQQCEALTMGTCEELDRPVHHSHGYVTSDEHVLQSAMATARHYGGVAVDGFGTRDENFGRGSPLPHDRGGETSTPPPHGTAPCMPSSCGSHAPVPRPARPPVRMPPPCPLTPNLHREGALPRVPSHQRSRPRRSSSADQEQRPDPVHHSTGLPQPLSRPPQIPVVDLPIVRSRANRPGSTEPLECPSPQLRDPAQCRRKGAHGSAPASLPNERPATAVPHAAVAKQTRANAVPLEAFAWDAPANGTLPATVAPQAPANAAPLMLSRMPGRVSADAVSAIECGWPRPVPSGDVIEEPYDAAVSGTCSPVALANAAPQGMSTMLDRHHAVAASALARRRPESSSTGNAREEPSNAAALDLLAQRPSLNAALSIPSSLDAVPTPERRRPRPTSCPPEQHAERLPDTLVVTAGWTRTISFGRGSDDGGVPCSRMSDSPCVEMPWSWTSSAALPSGDGVGDDPESIEVLWDLPSRHSSPRRLGPRSLQSSPRPGPRLVTPRSSPMRSADRPSPRASMPRPDSPSQLPLPRLLTCKSGANEMELQCLSACPQAGPSALDEHDADTGQVSTETALANAPSTVSQRVGVVVGGNAADTRPRSCEGCVPKAGAGARVDAASNLCSGSISAEDGCNVDTAALRSEASQQLSRHAGYDAVQDLPAPIAAAVETARRRVASARESGPRRPPCRVPVPAQRGCVRRGHQRGPPGWAFRGARSQLDPKHLHYGIFDNIGSTMASVVATASLEE